MTASGASTAGRLGSNTRGEIKMLARLAVDGVIIVITCAPFLLVFWACDNDRAESAADQSHRAVLET
jgi:hypothetical protein